MFIWYKNILKKYVTNEKGEILSSFLITQILDKRNILDAH